MRIKKFVLLTAILFHALVAKAGADKCEQLFEKSFKTSGFIIEISGKKQSESLIALAHEKLTADLEISNLNRILTFIKINGLENLPKEDRKFIIKFRQNSSFLRSIYQTSDKRHQGPEKFANFVRDFGVLKDYLLLDDSLNTKKVAKRILKKYADLDFTTLIQDTRPASKKSVRKYFKHILKDTQTIMAKERITVDELHDVRKHLRDVLRYMQITGEINGREETDQIEFLKKTNMKLGELCDENAGRILMGEINEDTLIEFPDKIRPRVMHFLENFEIVVGE